MAVRPLAARPGRCYPRRAPAAPTGDPPVNPTLLIAVAAGGAVGAIARYTVTSAVPRWLGHGFPWGTVVVNVAGSLLMGLLIDIMARRWSAPPEARVFLVTGVLGAFTTFSTFSLDVVTLYERGALMAAALYVAGSVIAGVLALFAGMWLGRVLL
ncbi:fluoride efflux transporter CrcB [Roseospira navarrensis]|uniref:Fluoride-specific ion channel FluC n=1 Tax=Roseospira navarrensis TaxID=140058 RepID=A0A7X1ZEU3_9PROT|nr:fluoride efflux transporter CrcB [Roseospira navarrensis]